MQLKEFMRRFRQNLEHFVPNIQTRSNVEEWPIRDGLVLALIKPSEATFSDQRFKKKVTIIKRDSAEEEIDS
jgi:hypothetical protein